MIILFQIKVNKRLVLCQTFFVPVEEFLDSVFNLDFMCPAEGVELADVDELAHRAVRLAGVELDCTREADCLDYQFGQFPDGQFLAGADIDVAVADLAKGRDGAAAACAVVAIDHAVGLDSVMDGRVFLNADDILEIYVQQDVNRCVGHILAPKELTERSACTPECDLVVFDAIECKHLQYCRLIGVPVNDIADSLSVLFDVRSYRSDAQILADSSPIAVVD